MSDFLRHVDTMPVNEIPARFSKYLSKTPLDERLRPQWIGGVLKVASLAAAYDTDKNCRDFGNIDDALRAQIVPLLLQAYELVNNPICGPGLKYAMETMRPIVGTPLPRLIRNIREAVEGRESVEASLLERTAHAASLLERATYDLLKAPGGRFGATGDEQGGDAGPTVHEETLSKRRRMWRWVSSTATATYRITIEAGWSALLEKLSGR